MQAREVSVAARDRSLLGRLPGALQALAMLAWPFLVVAGPRLVGTRWTAALVALLLLPAAVQGARGGRAGWRSLGFAAGGATLAFAAAALDDDRLLLAWPVIVSAALLGAFALSLRHGGSIVEGFARLRKPDLSAPEVAYCRKVTLIWCGFFVANGGTAAALALSGRRDLWALYTGVIAYLLMGALFAGEWLVRPSLFPPGGSAR